MAPDRHQPVLVATDVAAQQAKVQDHLHAVGPPRVLRDAHAPDEHRVFGVANQLGKLLNRLAAKAGLSLDVLPRYLLRFGAELLHIDRVLVDELVIQPALGKQNLEHSVQERDVAALRNREPIVSDVGAEQRASGGGRHPIACHARLVVRIDQHDLRAEFLGLVQVLGQNGLVVGRVGTEEHHQVGAVEILVRAGRRGDTDRCLHRRGRRRVTEARGIFDVVGAKEPRHLLRDIIYLIGDTARSHEERQALGINIPQFVGEQAVSFIPGDAGETLLALAAQHRIGQSAQFSKLGIRTLGQVVDVLQQRRVECRHGVEPQQIQPRHAEVHTVDRPVMQAGDAQRAAVAHALGHHLPRVAKVVLVFPDNLEHVAKMLRLGQANAKRQQLLQLVGTGFLNLV